MTHIAINKPPPLVYDDPVLCGPIKGPDGCDHRRPNYKEMAGNNIIYDGWICWLFDYEFPPCNYEKCDECKTLYQEVKK